MAFPKKSKPFPKKITGKVAAKEMAGMEKEAGMPAFKKGGFVPFKKKGKK